MFFGDDNDYNNELYLGLALTVGFLAYKSQKKPLPLTQELKDQVFLITGGNSGIGKAAAMELARRGGQVLLGCRNLQAGSAVCQEINQITNSSSCTVKQVDMASMKSIEKFSREIKEEKIPVNVLINNAGAMFLGKGSEYLTKEGHDLAMCTNFQGPVMLSKSLDDVLLKTAKERGIPSRIIHVGSRLEHNGSFPTCDEQNTWREWLKTPVIPYSTFQAYANSKLALTTWSIAGEEFAMKDKNELGQYLRTTTNIVTPGMVNTSLPRFMPSWQLYLSYPIRWAMLRSPEKGAETIVYAATAPELSQITGRYFGDMKDITDTASASARDPLLFKRLRDAFLYERTLEKSRKK